MQIGISRWESIYKYISDNPDCIKTEVIKFMEGRSAVATTHKIIQEMISTQVINVKVDAKNSQIHHLAINKKNLFNGIISKINELEELVGYLNHAISVAHEQKLFDDRQFRSMVYYAQLTTHSWLSLITKGVVNNITSFKDPDILYARIMKLLALCSKPNKLIAPTLEIDVRALELQLTSSGKKIDKARHDLCKEISEIILCLSAL